MVTELTLGVRSSLGAVAWNDLCPSVVSVLLLKGRNREVLQERRLYLSRKGRFVFQNEF